LEQVEVRDALKVKTPDTNLLRSGPPQGTKEVHMSTVLKYVVIPADINQGERKKVCCAEETTLLMAAMSKDVGRTTKQIMLGNSGCLLVNAEGPLLQLHVNTAASVLAEAYIPEFIGPEVIAGDAVLMGVGERGELQDVPASLIDELRLYRDLIRKAAGLTGAKYGSSAQREAFDAFGELLRVVATTQRSGQ